VGIHWEIPLNINLNINNEKQDCKIGTMCMGGTSGRREGEGRLRWQYTYMKSNRTKKPLAIALSGVGRELKGRDDGGNVTNVQYKSNRNCHYESPP
jgi:hypothetical protein